MAPISKKPQRFSKRLVKMAEIKALTQTLTNLLPDVSTENKINDDSHVIIKRCPICGLIFDSIESRQNHETATHFLPAEGLPINPVQKSESTPITEQQEFLLNFNLTKNVSFKPWAVMDILASRPQVLKSIRAETGGGNAIGQYECHHCEYKTTRLFILWAHMTTCHLEPIYEKKSNPYCVLCNRFITKRTTLIKHYKKCIKNQESVKTDSVPPPVKRYTCDVCNESFDSVTDLERHFYNHVAIARANKDANNNVI